MLFEVANLGINKGQRVALIGINGSGKSTLLRIMAGLENPDTGTVGFRKGVTIRFLAQEPDLDPELTVFQNLFQADTPELVAIRAYELLLADPQADPVTMQKAIAAVDQLKAWDYESRIKEILDRLGITDWERPVNILSGGQKKRVALARALLEQPDLLIMDEPTNHLDVEAIEWLEGFLAQQTKALLMVTHDRYFLDRVSNEIWELSYGEIHTYQGNYDYFLEKRAEREEMRATEQDKARKLLRKELEWSRRQPQARGTKSKARLDNIDVIQEKARKLVRKEQIELNIKQEWGGKTILELHHVNKAFGDLKILNSFTYAFMRGEKVGIVGPNGVGKTTFLEMLTGGIPVDGGKIKLGDNTQFGYYTQKGLDFKAGQTVLEVVQDAAEVIELEKGRKLTASQFLNLFLFPPNRQRNRVETLSGGEKKRLALLRILIQNPTFLILDEPTNDLDIITLEILEEFLIRYQGVVMVVSHDRSFMDQVVDHLFVFEGAGVVTDFPGNYSQYHNWKVEKEKEAARARKAAQDEAEKGKRDWRDDNKEKVKLTFKEQREYESLTTEIDGLESRKAELTALLSSGESDYEKIMAWGVELDQVTKDLETKSDRWLELAEHAE